MTTNPNDYDDAAYTDASVELMSLPVAEKLIDLWKAGAEIKNLDAELDNLVDDMNSEFKTEGVPFRVSFHIEQT